LSDRFIVGHRRAVVNRFKWWVFVWLAAAAIPAPGIAGEVPSFDEIMNMPIPPMPSSVPVASVSALSETQYHAKSPIATLPFQKAESDIDQIMDAAKGISLDYAVSWGFSKLGESETETVLNWGMSSGIKSLFGEFGGWLSPILEHVGLSGGVGIALSILFGSEEAGSVCASTLQCNGPGFNSFATPSFSDVGGGLVPLNFNPSPPFLPEATSPGGAGCTGEECPGEPTGVPEPSQCDPDDPEDPGCPT
jgi:hypothetical protein